MNIYQTQSAKTKTLTKTFSLAITLNLLVAVLLGGLTGAQLTSASNKDAYQPKSTFLSPIKESPIPFSGLALKWHQVIPANTSVHVNVRFFSNNQWSEWVELEGDIDDPAGTNSNRPESFIATNLSTAYQYKVELESTDPNITPIIENLEFTYIHANPSTTKEPETMSAEIKVASNSFLGATSTNTVAAATSENIRIISRSKWGANENLRLFGTDVPKGESIAMSEGAEKGSTGDFKIIKKITADAGNKTLTWPLEYPEKVKKIVIHHTATTKNLNDPTQAIRNIYYYHAITRGWGDIGYNYIVDTKGNIYEGRYGGDGVVGGHALNYNVGSVGIAVLGNYQESEVPSAVVNSLSALIKSKASLHGIDPMGSSMWGGKMLPNIIGHKDVGSTACPGEKLYALLPTIKKMAKGALIATIIDKRRVISKNADYDYDLSAMPELIQIDAGTSKIITIKIQNKGTKNWETGTYFMTGDNGLSQIISNGKGLKSKTIGKTVKSGETTTFTMELKASHDGGFANLEIFPMIDGTKKIEKYLNIPVQVIGANYDYEFISLEMSRTYLKSNQTAVATLTLRNTGSITWKRDGNNKIRIGTENSRDHVSRVLEKPNTRLAGLEEKEVKPNEIGTFKIKLKAPAREGQYREYFSPVIEGVTWLPNRETYLEFFVSNTSYKADYMGAGDMGTFLPGEKKQIWMEFTNIGRLLWKKTGNNALKFDTSLSKGIKLTDTHMEDESVLPGETARILATVEAPKEEGMYRIIVTPTIRGKSIVTRPIVLYVKVSKKGLSENTWISATTPSKTLGSTNNNIKIGISFAQDPIISADGTFKLFDGTKELKTFNKNEKVSVNMEAGKYRIKGSNSAFAITNPPRFTPVGSAILRIDNYENHPSWKPELNDNKYKGNLEVHYYENKLVVVNELNLEDYLKGLAEISATENYEKIKAIIVLARSYAKYYMTIGEKFPGAPYHLTDDPARSQFYLGYEFALRNPTGSKAVNDTKNEVVTYNGTVIKTPYFSSSDGRTRSAEEVWGWKDTPYLVSVDDPGCKGKQMAGHGVGLSGCGAQYFANQGKNYKEIIKYYFKGVEIATRL